MSLPHLLASYHLNYSIKLYTILLVTTYSLTSEGDRIYE